MNSNKSLIIISALVIVGSVLISQLSLGVGFALGVIVSVLILRSTSTNSVPSKKSILLKPDDANNTTLYVGNLSYKASESHVKDLFSEYGSVNNVRLMKDKRTGKRRGFGFVEVASSDADAMIAALNEYEYMQRTIKVRIANDPKHPPMAES